MLNVGDTYVADDEGEGKRDTTTTSGRAAPARRRLARRRDVDEVVVLHGDAAGRAGERGQVRGPAAVDERAEERGRLAGAAGGEERARREAHHRARGAAAAWRSGRAGTTRRAAAGR